jgi:hypothetical protein
MALCNGTFCWHLIHKTKKNEKSHTNHVQMCVNFNTLKVYFCQETLLILLLRSHPPFITPVARLPASLFPEEKCCYFI